MVLSFLQYGITATDRTTKKSKKADKKWDELPQYFRNKMKDLEENDNIKRLVRTTKHAENNFGEQGFRMEARMLFGNANVPFGYKKNKNGKNEMVFAVPCKDEAQGKKQLIEFIEGLERDNDVKQVVADWLQSKTTPKFDNSTIPDEFITTS